MSGLDHADWVRLHQIANGEFDVRVRQIMPDWWSASTPCEEWDVYELVNHVVVESMWTPVLLAGHHPDTVGGLDGDVIEGDPVDAWEQARAEAIEAVLESDPEAEVFLEEGSITAARFVRQKTLDLAVHAWDLGRAIAGDEQLDPELVEAIGDLVEGNASYFAAGSEFFEASLSPDPDDDRWSRVLRILGRDPE